MKSPIVLLIVTTLTFGVASASSTFRIEDFLLDAEVQPYDSLLRQRRQADNTKKGTDLCTEDQLKAVVAKIDACETKAEVILNNAFSSNNEADIFNVLCELIRAKLICLETHVPTCLKPDKVSIVRLNFLAKEAEKAQNSTFLGQNFIKTCPELNNFQGPKL